MLLINRWLQSISGIYTDYFFLFISLFITDIPLVLLLAYIYWCVSKEKGLKMGLVLTVGMQLNFGIKDIFKIERPYVIDKNIINKDIKYGYGYSFPSNHCQMLSSLYISFKKYFKNKYVNLILILIFLMMISRMYLGVHTIIDVVAGVLIGIVATYILAYLIDELYKKNVFWLTVFLIPGILVLILFNDNDALKILLLHIGFLMGYIIDVKCLYFTNAKGFKNKALEYFLGIVGIAAIYLIIDNAFKYFLIGVWVSYGAPLIFMILRRRKKEDGNSKN